MEITDALGTALGLSGLNGLYVTPSNGDIGPNPCTLGTLNCFNAEIQLTNEATLSTLYGQGYYYPGTGTTQASNEYDINSVVEHETDEILGTSSCGSNGLGGVVTNGCNPIPNPNNVNDPSAIDLFRYNASGPTLIDPQGLDYFSENGGTKQSPYYNTAGEGGDYGDFSTSCDAVQDAAACPGGVLDITTDAGTPEIKMLNAVGYNLVPAGSIGATPEPGTLTLLGTGVAALGGIIRRRRKV